ncbi:MAG: transposase [Anaerolineae bacterium]
MTRFKDKYRIETTRLPGWDYTSAGWYFVTICTRDRQMFFGHIENGEMHLSPIGEIAAQFWCEIPQHTAGSVTLDAWVVMPNHVHGIIVIHDTPMVETLQCNVSTTTTATTNNPMSAISPRAGSLGAIIRSYKSAVTRWCRQNGHPEFGWQSRFYDHIIRNEKALNNIRRYITENPLRWQEDQNNPENVWI